MKPNNKYTPRDLEEELAEAGIGVEGVRQAPTAHSDIRESQANALTQVFRRAIQKNI